MSERLNVDNIVRNILNCRSFLSRSTRGVETEVNGKVARVIKTARGLTLTLDSKKKVVWSCPESVADKVIAACPL